MSIYYGYTCPTCGGWFNGAHYCVGPSRHAQHTHTWPPALERPSDKLRREEAIQALEEAIKKLKELE